MNLPPTALLIRRVLLATVALGLVLLALLALGFYFYCPCDRIPGGYLVGEEASDTVSDWTFANDAPLCQIEVGGLLRHSVNLNCMAVEGALYLSCARCDGKRWSTIALANPNGRIRIGDTVYPVTLTRVTDAETLDAAWAARAAKFGRPVSQPRTEDWWSFHLESR